jgi:Na+/H+-translocating membrane pyrophosphatase
MANGANKAIAQVERGASLLASVIAVVITLAFIVALWSALSKLDDDQQYARAKELVQIAVNLLGVVVGYYFGARPAQAIASAANARVDDVKQTARDAANVALTIARRTPAQHQAAQQAVGGGAMDPDVLKLQQLVGRLD